MAEMAQIVDNERMHNLFMKDRIVMNTNERIKHESILVRENLETQYSEEQEGGDVNLKK